MVGLDSPSLLSPPPPPHNSPMLCSPALLGFLTFLAALCTLGLGLGLGLGLRGSALPPLVAGECESLRCVAPSLRIEADQGCVRSLYAVQGRGLVSSSVGATLVSNLGSATEWPMPCVGSFSANGGTFFCATSLPDPGISSATQKMCVCGVRGKEGGRTFLAERVAAGVS